MDGEACYQRLGLDPYSKHEDDEIRTAYRALALTSHPDKNPNNPNAHTIFIAIQEAYEKISNAEFRRAYEATLYSKDVDLNSEHVNVFESSLKRMKTDPNYKHDYSYVIPEGFECWEGMPSSERYQDGGRGSSGRDKKVLGKEKDLNKQALLQKGYGYMLSIEHGASHAYADFCVGYRDDTDDASPRDFYADICAFYKDGGNGVLDRAQRETKHTHLDTAQKGLHYEAQRGTKYAKLDRAQRAQLGMEYVEMKKNQQGKNKDQQQGENKGKQQGKKKEPKKRNPKGTIKRDRL